ncbi:MAG: hypothetical protein FWC01_07595, partial [Treponema sp.]|nr:hypothetical protein [Treponema sp.]
PPPRTRQPIRPESTQTDPPQRTRPPREPASPQSPQFGGSAAGNQEARQAAMDDFRRNTLFLGLRLGPASEGTFNLMVDADFKPFDISWLALKAGFGLSGGSGDYRRVVKTNGVTNSNLTFTDSVDIFSLYFAPKAKFQIRNFDLGVYIGLGFGFTANESLQTGSPYFETREFTDVLVGVVLGVEFDIKLGSGSLYFNLNGGVMNNTVYPNISQVNNVQYNDLEVLSCLNLCIGYRFGFLKK